MEFVYYFLPIIILIGLITAYEDYKNNKIRNKWLIMGVILFLLALITIYFFQLVTFNRNLLINWFGGFFLSLIIGFFAWWYDFWSAGDAKLFSFYTLLLPPTVYEMANFGAFSPINLLINAVIPYALYSGTLILIKLKDERIRKLFIKKLKKDFFVSLIVYLGVFIMIDFMIKHVNVLIDNISLTFLLTMVIYQLVSMAQNKNKTTKYGVIIISVILLLVKAYFDMAFFSIKNIFPLLISYLVYRLLIGSLRSMDKEFSKNKVYVENLKEGMIVSDRIIKKSNKYVISKKGKDKTKPLGVLTKEMMEFIKNEKNNFRFKKVNVQKTVPFGVLLFIGALLTIMLKGNVFILLKFF